MKVLHISHTDLGSGAFAASFRLHHALQKSGIESLQLVKYKNSTDKNVITFIPKFNFIRDLLSSSISLCMAVLDFPYINLPRSINYLPSSIHTKINALHPDIVHIQWIGDNFLPIPSLLQIKAPIVWTFHDLWPIQGIYHYQESRKHGVIADLINSVVVKYKHRDILKRKDIYIVSPSKWMESNVQESYLQSFQNVCIPNCINTDTFAPINKLKARRILNLDQQKKIVIFGASDLNDPRKGFQDFIIAMKDIYKLPSIQDRLQILVYGSGSIDSKISADLPILHMGFINDQNKMALVLAAADISVFPSKIDNLPSTILESLSCGTPVVSYDVGGIRDLVKHKINGYLANEGKVTQLTAGIKLLLNLNTTEIAKMRKASRKLVQHSFSMKVVAQKHIKYYKNIVARIN